MAKIYKNDVGTVIRVHTNIDEDPDIKIKKPSGTIVTWTITSHINTADDNYVDYVIQTGDLNEVGRYIGHLKGSQKYLNMFSFEVYDEYL